jgi:hypothetical protein
VFIDTHTHIHGPEFDSDCENVLTRAKSAGVDACVAVGTDVASSRLAVDLAQRHGGVWASVGVHPHEAVTLDAEAAAWYLVRVGPAQRIEKSTALCQNEAAGGLRAHFLSPNHASRRKRHAARPSLFSSQSHLAYHAPGGGLGVRGAGLGSGLTWLTLGAEWPVSVVLATWDADGVSLDRVDFKAKKWGPRLFRSPGA